MKTTITTKITSSGMGLASILTLLLALSSLAPSQVAANPPEGAGNPPYQSLVDNFVGPNSPLSYLAINSGAVVMPEKGSLTLTSTKAPRWLALAMVLKDGEPVVAQSTSMRAVVRLANEASALGLWTRSGAYVCNLYPKVTEGPNGEPVITSVLSLGSWFGFFVHEEMEVNLNAVDNDVVVEFDTIGATITMRAWAADDPSVVYETLGWTNPDPAPPEGTLGLGALGGDGGLPPEVIRGVDYYQFKLKIIPPTSNRGG